MQSKRGLCSLLAAVLLFAMACMLPAYAQAAPQDAALHASITPDAMAQAGSATVTLSIQNQSATVMEGLTVSQGATAVREIGSLDAGGETTASWEVQVGADKLGHPFSYSLTWTQDGQAHSKPFDVTVQRLSPNPSMRMERIVSAGVVEAGQQVDIQYTLVNDGNIVFENLIVTDTVGGVVGSKPRIAPGETVVFTASPTILSNTQSNPKATFLYNGMAMELTAGDPVKILLAQSQVVLEVKADKTEVGRGDSVKLTGSIQNAGTIDIGNLVVSDETLGEVYRAPSLAAGETAAFTKEITVEEAQDYLFHLTYSTQRGEMLQSDAFVSITIEGELPPAPKLRVEVTPALTTLKTAGDVTWSIEVFNEGAVPVTGIIITERAQGEVASADLIGPGQSNLYKATIPVEYNREMRFTVSAMDSTGRAFTIAAEPVSVLVGPQPSASAAPGSSPAQPSAPGGLAFIEKLLTFDLVGFLYLLLGILVVLVIILGVLLFATGVHRGLRYLKQREDDRA